MLSYSLGEVRRLARIVSLGRLGFPPMHLNGLLLRNGTTDPDHEVIIGVGTARDATDAFDLKVTSEITVDISASGDLGLDTGSPAADTWYALYAIGNSAQRGSISGVLSLASGSLALPSGYDVYRRVCYVRTDGLANVLPFIHAPGNWFYLKTALDDIDVSTLGTTPTNFTVDLPPAGRVLGRFRLRAARASAQEIAVSVWNPDLTDYTPDIDTYPLANLTARLASSDTPKVTAELELFTDASQRLRAVADAASTDFDIATLAWFDDRAAASGAGNSITLGDIIAALTYTPLNKAGDTMTGALAMAGQVISDALINRERRKVGTQTHSSVGTLTLDLNTALTWEVAMQADATLAFSNVPSGGEVTVTVYYTQDGTGSRTCDQSGIGTVESQGVDLELDGTASRTSGRCYVTRDGGTTWEAYAFLY